MRPFLVMLALALVLPSLAMAKGEEPFYGPVQMVDVGLDPGHSYMDVGAVGGGLREYEVTFAIASRVKGLLEERGLTVSMSRQDDAPLTDFSSPDPTDAVMLEQQARILAVGSAEMYVSIHLNGYSDPRVRGLEVYYNGDNRGAESYDLAVSIHERLLEDVRAAGYDLPDRGVNEDLTAGKPYGHFFSLRGAMPSVLVEAMFLTNPTESSLLGDEATLDAIARGIAEGILQYGGQETEVRDEPTGSQGGVRPFPDV